MDETKTLARIRLVTARYNELHGLGGVALGLAFTIAFGIYFAMDARSEGAGVAAMIGALALTVPGVALVLRFYRATYGRVQQPPRRANRGLWHGVFCGIFIGLEPILGTGRMLTPFVVIGLLFLRVAMRDWPLRGYHLFGAAACALGIVIQLQAPAFERPLISPPAAASFLLLGLACIPIGFLDHRLLATTMKRTAGEEASNRA